MRSRSLVPAAPLRLRARKSQPGVQGRFQSRAVSYIFFALLAFPLVMLVLALVGDVARTIVAQRQVSNAAQAAALAGAWQVGQGTGSINQCPAVFAAVETYNSAVAAGMMSLAEPAVIPSGASNVVGNCVPPVTWTDPEFADGYLDISFDEQTGAQSIIVQAGWRVPDVLFASFFGLNLSYEGQPVTAVASICDPNDPQGVTQGFCERPE